MSTTPAVVRSEDRPLHEDVRWLASALGRVIRRLEGEAAFRAVEDLRTECRARRHGVPGAPDLDALLDRVSGLPVEVAASAARGFTLFFLLINTAEQVHRVRRQRAHRDDAGPQPASPRWAMAQLDSRGVGAAEARAALAALRVRPVLTAHPTEATRRTVLSLQERVAGLIEAREEAGPGERQLLDEALEAEVELLWLTAEVRRDRPSVMDEVGSALWYLEHRLMDAAGEVTGALARAFEEVYGEPLGVGIRLCPGSWVGGDRDGNPFVTPELTVAACRRNAFAVLRHYEGQVDALTALLSVSARIATTPEPLRASIYRDQELLPEVWQANRRRDAEEPLRLKLSFVRERIGRTRALLARRDAGHAAEDPVAYASAAELRADLDLVADALDAVGAHRARHSVLDPLRRRLDIHGWHGFRLDVREDARVHTRALDGLAAAVGLEPLDQAALSRELLGRRPLHAPHLEVGEETSRALAVFAAMRAVQDEVGRAAADTAIVSMCGQAADLLRVLLLAREAGLVDLAADPPRSRVDAVPLFETLDDLVRAPEILTDLFADPAYRRQLQARGNHQEVMLGYSDSAKDAGLLPASWALYRAQERIVAVCRDAGVEPTLFHGRGGTVGRGGGSPVFRALSALPPGTVRGRIKITEQGELVSQKFAMPSVARRSLEVMTTGTLLAAFSDWREELAPGEEARFRALMDRLSAAALPVYRRTVHGDERLFRLFRAATPMSALASVHYGSRPAYRGGGAGTMAGIRAIPWVFGWTQIRLMLPAWLGVGTALAEVIGDGGLPDLVRMAEAWPFFDDLLGKVEMVCAKSDVEVARMYLDRLGADPALVDALVAEHARTLRGISAIRGELLRGEDVLRATLELRDPYLDALSLLQASLLVRARDLPEDHPERPALEAALGTTLNGVAQGLRNTA